MSDTLETFEIGEAKDNFNVNASVWFTHNFYRRGITKEFAECLMCALAQIRTLLKTTDGNTTGKFNK